MTSDRIETSDVLAIHELLARYCHAMDAARADLAIELFTEDAVLETPVGSAQGRAAIQEWIEGRLALRSTDHQVGHYLLNPLIAPTDANHARIRSMLLYTRQAVDGQGRAELLSTGIYEDEVARSAERWRFARRRWTLSAPLDGAYFAPAVG